MNLFLLLLAGVIAFLLAQSNHPSLGIGLGALVIAWMVVMPFLENAIFSRHYPHRRPPPPSRRRPRP